MNWPTEPMYEVYKKSFPSIRSKEMLSKHQIPAGILSFLDNGKTITITDTDGSTTTYKSIKEPKYIYFDKTTHEQKEITAPDHPVIPLLNTYPIGTELTVTLPRGYNSKSKPGANGFKRNY